MKPSVRLEQESEEARTRVAETLDELRFRATPGQIVDQLLDYTREGGGAEYMRNLRREIVDHPVPMTLIGAGIAWMIVQSMVPSREGAGYRYSLRSDAARAGEAVRDFGERAGETARDVGERAGERVRNLGERVGAATDKVREAGSSAVDRLRDARLRAGDAIGQAKDSATSAIRTLRDRTSSAYDSATMTIKDSSSAIAQGSQNAIQFSKEQPLVLAGLGLAVGAVIGALLPPTETEDRLLGETADDAKETARRIAERAKEKSMDVYADVKSTVHEGGSGSGTSSAMPSSTSSAMPTGTSSGMQSGGSTGMHSPGSSGAQALGAGMVQTAITSHPAQPSGSSASAMGGSRSDPSINRPMDESAAVEQEGKRIAGERSAAERGRDPSASNPHTDEQRKP